MCKAEQAMNYDLAIDIINLMKTMASNKKDSAQDADACEELDREIDMYCYEEGVLNGRYGGELARQSLYDKVFNQYSPIIKREFASE